MQSDGSSASRSRRMPSAAEGAPRARVRLAAAPGAGSAPQRASQRATQRAPQRAPQRARWTSQRTFIFAAIGSAIGFGNIWRFPMMAYTHGGGAFLLPYCLALVVAALPIVVLEFALGGLKHTHTHTHSHTHTHTHTHTYQPHRS